MTTPTPALRAEVEQAISRLSDGPLLPSEQFALQTIRVELSRLAAENAELRTNYANAVALAESLSGGNALLADERDSLLRRQVRSLDEIKSLAAERDEARRELEALRRSIKEAREAELFEDGFDPYPDGTSVDPRSYMDGRQDVLTEVDQRAAELLRGKGGNDENA